MQESLVVAMVCATHARLEPIVWITEAVVSPVGVQGDVWIAHAQLHVDASVGLTPFLFVPMIAEFNT